MFELEGRNALVTGAGRGVGLGIARALAAQGAAVAVNDLHTERAEAAASELAESGARAMAVPFDVTSYAAVEAGVGAVERELGAIDILVNNAGVPEGMDVRRFAETDPTEWQRYIDLNAYGVLNCCRAVINGMCERGWGRIVTISSGAGQVGIALGVSAYGAGKGAGISFMRHLAVEVAASGVTANTLALGIIDNQYDPSVTEHLARGIPVGRLGKPEDIAAAVSFLVSPEASWITGQTIGVNGGQLTT